MDQIKTSDPACVNIEQNDDEEEKEGESVIENKTKIQLDLLLFEQDDESSSDDSEDEVNKS